MASRRTTDHPWTPPHAPTTDTTHTSAGVLAVATGHAHARGTPADGACVAVVVGDEIWGQGEGISAAWVVGMDCEVRGKGSRVGGQWSLCVCGGGFKRGEETNKTHGVAMQMRLGRPEIEWQIPNMMWRRRLTP